MALPSEKGEITLESLNYEYDPSGNRIGQVDRLSQETTYGYDALNRLVKVAKGKPARPTAGASSTS